MMIPVEGSRVTYIGDEEQGLVIGDSGQVLAAGPSMSHVALRTGARNGEILYLHNMDLVGAATNVSEWDTDLYGGGSLVAFAVRETYDARGPRGLFKALEQEGHLSTLASVGDEAISYVATKLRNDPSIREVLGQLEEDDAQEFLSYVAEVVIRDSVGG